MLKLAVGEQGPREEAGQLAKQEGILFKDVLSLQLDFQSARLTSLPGHLQLCIRLFTVSQPPEAREA